MRRTAFRLLGANGALGMLLTLGGVGQILHAADAATPPVATSNDGDLSPFKHLSLEELMDVTVTSVLRRPEPLVEAASAIQVISGEEIRRSGATSLPEALRLAPNLQVAQVNASQWAISARGFNNVLADKMLVMIDGRTVYTPLYAGVFWDVQNPLLEDIDRIEVISGPGGTLWGANAVNGVISVISKSARDTQGAYASVARGTSLERATAARYGGDLGNGLFYRVYGERFARADTIGLDGHGAGDAWGMTQGGFRADWYPNGSADTLTFQGDFYDGHPDPDGGTPVLVNGGNLLGRWTRPLRGDDELRVQAYVDRTWRDFGNGFAENLKTYDVDWQHRFHLGQQHTLTWGQGYRLMVDQEDNLQLFAFDPGRQVLHLASAFVQDEIRLVPDRLRLVLGSKFEHNDYTGMEYQPAGHLAWTPDDSNTIWAAVSHAVRTPSRIDRDFTLSIAPGVPFIDENADFESERMTAYELGWRSRPHREASLSLSLFYNRYDRIRSVEPGPPPFGIPVTYGNGVRGSSLGAELAGDLLVTEDWHLRGGYTFFKKHLTLAPGSQDLNQATAESDDPEHQAVLQSMLDLPGAVDADATIRYVDDLPNPHVAGYFALDVRLAWHPAPHLELAAVGQNLLDHRHQEFIPASPSPRQIERSAYASATVRW